MLRLLLALGGVAAVLLASPTVTNAIWIDMNVPSPDWLVETSRIDKPVPGNLLDDPDAEQTEDGWTRIGVERLSFGAKGLPSTEEASARDFGSRAFVVTQDGGSMSQIVPLVASVDRLGYGGIFSDRTASTLSVDLLTADGEVLLSTSHLASHAWERPESGAEIHYRSSIIYDVPASARSARVTFTASTPGAWSDRLFLSPEVLQVPLAGLQTATAEPELAVSSPVGRSVVRLYQRTSCAKPRAIGLRRNATRLGVKKVVLKRGARTVGTLTTDRSRVHLRQQRRSTRVKLVISRDDGSQERTTLLLGGCSRSGR